jgi:hypothetical protein
MLTPSDFVLKKSIGVGWSAGTDDETLDWSAYYAKARRLYYSMGKTGGDSWWTATNALHNRVQKDDLCWTRDELGLYYLGRVTGEWQYRNTLAHSAAEIVNVRRCEWQQAEAVDDVPSEVVQNGGFSNTCGIAGLALRLMTCIWLVVICFHCSPMRIAETCWHCTCKCSLGSS